MERGLLCGEAPGSQLLAMLSGLFEVGGPQNCSRIFHRDPGGPSQTLSERVQCERVGLKTCSLSVQRWVALSRAALQGSFSRIPAEAVRSSSFSHPAVWFFMACTVRGFFLEMCFLCCSTVKGESLE